MKVGFASLVGLPPNSIGGCGRVGGRQRLVQGMEVNIGPGYPVTDELHGHLDLDRILSDGPDATRTLR